ncbi:MAG: undecaprenyl-diphosphate phosphatase [Pseudomonadota bacterium]
MSLLQLTVLALVQGITEFLPISSSGHLILVPQMTDWEDQGLAMDIAVHVGTLGAVLLYFRSEVVRLGWGAVATLGLANGSSEAAGNKRLFWLLVLATVPVVIAGLALKTLGFDEQLRDPLIIAAASIGFGILLYWADMAAPRVRQVSNLSVNHTLLIGLAQVTALIPGASRAGTTMTAARALGYTRPEAARFSMLMSMPTIAAAGLLLGLDVAETGTAITADMAIAAALAFLSALAAIHFLMRWLESASMTLFVVYRVALGVFLLWWFV